MIKANVPSLRSALSADSMTERRTLAAIHKEFSNVRRLFKFCTIREVSAPPRTYASNDALHFRQGVKPPPCASRIKGGVQQAHFFTNAIMGGGC